MALNVAKITQSVADVLLADPIWDYEIRQDKNYDLIMDLEDAVNFLEKRDFIEIEFMPLQIGSPLPRKRIKKH